MKLRTALLLASMVVAGIGVYRLRSPRRQPAGEPIAAPASSVYRAPDAPAARPVARPPGVPSALGPTAEDRAKLALLDELLESANDNDPRLDLAFRDLTPAAKQLMRERYRRLAEEKRNERGTVVFLLGRELRNPEDAAFLGEVLAEAACKSLRDCRQASAAAPGGDEHAAVNGTTLAYPQIVALRSVEGYLRRKDRDPAVVAALAAAVKKGRSSGNPRVAGYAQRVSVPMTGE